MVEQAGDGGAAGWVGTACELAQNAELAVFAQPASGTNHTLDTSFSANASLAGSRAVAVEVLVHLIDDLVLGVGQRGEVGVGNIPGPGTGPGVSFNEDVLCL